LTSPMASPFMLTTFFPLSSFAPTKNTTSKIQ
jgi:hypothetical protein